jgi:ribosomal protein L14
MSVVFSMIDIRQRKEIKMALTKSQRSQIEKQVRSEYTSQAQSLNNHALYHILKGLDAKGADISGRVVKEVDKYAFMIIQQIASEVLSARGTTAPEFNAFFFTCEHI